MAWSAEQRRNASIIYKVGLGLGASLRDIQVAITAAIVESGLRNLDYGDRDSIGMFQQRDAWGSRAARLDPASSARMFFLGGAAGQQGLLDISNRASRSIGSLAQDVQVSAYPDRYGAVADDAGALLRGIDPAAGDIPTGSTDGGRTLGSVAPMDGLSQTRNPITDTPLGSDLNEVDALGELTADATGIGELTFDDGALGEAPASPVDELTFDQGPLNFGGANDPQGHLLIPTEGGGGGGTPGQTYQYYDEPSGSTSGGSAPSGHFEPSGAGYQTSTTATSSNYGLGSVTPQLVYAVDALGPKFNVETVGGYRASAVDPHGHPAGLAADFMTNSEQGDALAAYAKEHAEELGVDYIIWEQHIWSADRADEGWRPMEDRGSYTANHMDHVHLNVRPDFKVPDEPFTEKVQRGREDAARAAERLIGVPFEWGGESYTGLDAVGLVRTVYKSVGADVPKDQFELVHRAEPITPEDLAPGDILVWDMHPMLGSTHFGVYLGNGNYAEARGPGSVVQVSNLDNLPENIHFGDQKVGLHAIKAPVRNADHYDTSPNFPTSWPTAPSSSGGKKGGKGPKSSGYEGKNPGNLPQMF